MSDVMKKHTGFYDEDFYKGQMDGSYRSGRRYASELLSIYRPDSVVDIGCGRGTWLKAFGELGSTLLVGVDGEWNSQANMTDQAIRFFAKDLNLPIKLSEFDRFDLAMSLEVAEHLAPESADQFVESLTNLSDAILFGAAYTQQGGTNHINEQPHSYWAEKFCQKRYFPFDLFRECFWGDSEIPYWYQQNTFLYAKENSALYRSLTSKGREPLKNLNFLNCVHPSLYLVHVNKKQDPVLIRTIRRLTPEPLRPLAKAIDKRIFKIGI